MSKLFEKPPQSVFAEGKNYEINTDFRVWLEIWRLMESEVGYEEKISKLLCLAYKNELPPHLDTAVSALLRFFSVGEEKRINKDGTQGERVMDFAADEGLIYAAFVQQYGIDLYEEELHWHKFIRLLNGLGDDTAFMRIVGYRSISYDKIKDKNTRKILRRLKNKYRLSGCVTDEEMTAALDGIM